MQNAEHEIASARRELAFYRKVVWLNLAVTLAIVAFWGWSRFGQARFNYVSAKYLIIEGNEFSTAVLPNAVHIYRGPMSAASFEATEIGAELSLRHVGHAEPLQFDTYPEWYHQKLRAILDSIQSEGK